MTNITELAQRARINAECGEHLSPAETMELAEALESEKRICATWRKTAKSTGEKLEKAQQRITHLESRTVKMPEPFELAGLSGGSSYYHADEVDAALVVAGIKVEAE
ncbi:RelE family toxin-antitoxin system [Klebsiella quasipneumoniae subsp. quasipneumoniae]